MTEEELQDKMRDHTADYAEQLKRLLEIDIAIMEATRDMMNVARDEVEKNPHRFFDLPAQSARGGQAHGGSTEEGLTGGQDIGLSDLFSGGGLQGAIGGVVIDLIKEDMGDIKKTIRDIFNRML